MNRNDRWTSFIWSCLGLHIAYEGYQLKLGSLHNPGCGFLIFGAGITLSILSLILFIRTFASKKEENKALWKGLQWPIGIKLMIALFAYALVLRWLGFLLATFLLMLFLFKGLVPQKWRIAFLLSIITITLTYLIFGVFLETQVPEGVLEKMISYLF
jgi:putative tricarboxylic transport membrane protein